MDRSQIDPEGNLAAQELGGTDSAAVHQSMGAPGSGQTSAELHDKSKSGQSIEGVGKQSVLQSSVDTKDPKMAQHRNLADDNAAPGQRGTVGGASAEDRVPVSSEQVAGERK